MIDCGQCGVLSCQNSRILGVYQQSVRYAYYLAINAMDSNSAQTLLPVHCLPASNLELCLIRSISKQNHYLACTQDVPHTGWVRYVAHTAADITPVQRIRAMAYAQSTVFQLMYSSATVLYTANHVLLLTTTEYLANHSLTTQSIPPYCTWHLICSNHNVT